MSDGYTPVEEMEVFRRYVTVADWIWDAVQSCPSLAVDTVGKQLICAADSVGADLVGMADTRTRMLSTSSSSLAHPLAKRDTGSAGRPTGNFSPAEEQIAEITGATPLLNRLIAYRRGKVRGGRIAEPQADYHLVPADPFAPFDRQAFPAPEPPNA